MDIFVSIIEQLTTNHLGKLIQMT